MRYRPLEGIRILDLARLIPGAAVTHYFADLGADVVKVEQPPVGDYLRDVRPMVEGLSLQHLTLDRNKRSIALGLRDDAGRAVLHRMIAEVDAAVVVSPPEAMRARGADWETLSALNPRLVYLSFTGFGADSPYSALPTHGSNLACFAGVHGHRGEDGVIVPEALPYGRYRVPMEEASLAAAFALLAALRDRDRSGRGRFLDLAIVDALMRGDYASMVDQVNNGNAYMVEVEQPTPRYAFYRAGDDLVLMVCPIEKRFWTAFCEVLDRPDLADHGNWSGNEMDFGVGDRKLYDEIQRTMATRTRAEWLDALVRARIPCSPAYTVAEAVADPAIGGRSWTTTTHPTTGTAVRVIGPRAFGGEPEDQLLAAPLLGQHTEEVLADLRVPDDLIEAARASGALAPTARARHEQRERSSDG